MADGVGFEPTKSVNPCRFSRPVPSTTRPPVRAAQSFIAVRLSMQARLILSIDFAILLAPKVAGLTDAGQQDTTKDEEQNKQANGEEKGFDKNVHNTSLLGSARAVALCQVQRERLKNRH